jgi:hypothetical protein
VAKSLPKVSALRRALAGGVYENQTVDPVLHPHDGGGSPASRVPYMVV